MNIKHGETKLSDLEILKLKKPNKAANIELFNIDFYLKNRSKAWHI
jgi:hypothetical protein